MTGSRRPFTVTAKPLVRHEPRAIQFYQSHSFTKPHRVCRGLDAGGHSLEWDHRHRSTVAERNLVVGQAADGAWTDNFKGRYAGRVYCTSLAVLTLAAQYKHQPLYLL